MCVFCKVLLCVISCELNCENIPVCLIMETNGKAYKQSYLPHRRFLFFFKISSPRLWANAHHYWLRCNKSVLQNNKYRSIRPEFSYTNAISSLINLFSVHRWQEHIHFIIHLFTIKHTNNSLDKTHHLLCKSEWPVYTPSVQWLIY